MNSKRLLIIFPDSKFDYRALNSIRGINDILVAPDLFGEHIDQDFISEINAMVEKSEINEISIGMTTETKHHLVLPEDKVIDLLEKNIKVLQQEPGLSNILNSGMLKINAFVYNAETGLFSDVACPFGERSMN